MAQRSVHTMLVDGKSEPAVVSVHDLTFIRGDGAFEVVSLEPSPSDSSVGVPVGVKLHLDRLKATMTSLRLPLQYDLDTVTEWLRGVGKSHGPGACRIVMTRGQPSKQVAPKCIMLHDPPAQYPPALRLVSMAAPWHIGYSAPFQASPMAYSDNVDVDAWHTIKWMSYAPNCLVTRLAQERGVDDALLLASDGRVLDGPNFAVGFVIDGKIRLISAGANHMLPSCTQTMAATAAKAAGLPFDETSVHFDESRTATAAFVMSATRHVMPVGQIDGKSLQSDDPLLIALQKAYWELVNSEVHASA